MRNLDQQRDSELWRGEIHWFLNVAPAELGAKGTLGGTVSVLERGGSVTGLPDTTPFTDQQLGWCVGKSIPERYTAIERVWRKVARETQAVLAAHYTLRNDLPVEVRVAVDGALGKLANAAVWIHDGEQLAKLLEACKDKGKQGRKGILQGAVKRTEERVRQAHRDWLATKELVDDTAKAAEERIPLLRRIAAGELLCA